MPKVDNLQGALELLVMKILRRGPNHGFALSSYIQQIVIGVIIVLAVAFDTFAKSRRRKV